MSIEVINNNEELQSHINKLINIDKKFDRLYKEFGTPDLRRKPNETNIDHFVSLLRAIVGQQLSNKAANAIFTQLENMNLLTPTSIKQVDDETLRNCGLSKQKIRYIRSLIEHNINFMTLIKKSDTEVIKILTAVTGIGQWTAEMYLLFTLGRVDILAVDDLAIKVAVQSFYQLDNRPTLSEMRNLTDKWSPHRSAASLLLWEYYGKLKCN